MALLHTDSFPYISPTRANPQRWDELHLFNAGEVCTIETTGGRFGGRWIHVEGDVWERTYCRKVIDSTDSTLIAQFGYKAITNASEGYLHVIGFLDDTTEHVHIRDYGGVFKAYRGSTLLGTATNTHAMNVWHQIELKVTFHDSAGIIQLKVNGVLILNLSGIDTMQTANAYATSFRIFNSFSPSGDAGMSDIIIMDSTGSYCNDFLGHQIVKLEQVNGNGNYSMFTPSAGTNYENVDEVTPDDDTSYNSGTVNNIDSFTKPSIAGANIEVAAVVPVIRCKASDALSAQVQSMVRSNNVNGFGPAKNVVGSYAWLYSPIYVDPNTSLPFLIGALNSAEVGYKRVA